MITSAFTCTGPYAILVLLGIKRVENRSVIPAPAKGRCATSCSKSFCREEYGEFVRWASRALKPEEFESVPAWDEVRDWPGKVVGCCDYEARGRGDLVLGLDGEGAVVTQWDEGCPYWWELAEVVAHNHPSGNTMPSAQDRELTAALKRQGESLGVTVLDHLVIGGDAFSAV